MGAKYKRKGMTIGTFDPLKGPRLAVGWLAMVDLMEDGEWHHRDELVERGLAESDLQRSTLCNLLSSMSAPDGPIERKGAVKTRRYRLVVE